MTMSKDRVRFYLQNRYFLTHNTTYGMRRDRCRNILMKAFGMDYEESACMMDRSPDGFWIVCRLDQFARFIVYRADLGNCINGIKDLKPVLFKQQDLYARLSRQFCIPEDTVKGLARALGYANDDDSHIVKCQHDSIDVSGNEHRGGEGS